MQERKAKNGSYTVYLTGSKAKKALYNINIERYDLDGYYRPDGSFTLLETSDYFNALEVFEKIVEDNLMGIVY